MTLETDTPKELVKLETQRDLLLQGFMSLEVVDEPTQGQAAAGLAQLRTFMKQTEENRKELVKPLNDHVKFINGRFETLLRPIKEAENYLELQIRKYRQRIEDARRKEQDRLQRLQERREERAEAAGKPSPIPEVIAPLVTGNIKTVETVNGKVSFRTDWKAEIVDEAKLPREYLMPDVIKINAVVKAQRGTIQIPGVRIYTEEVPVVRK